MAENISEQNKIKLEKNKQTIKEINEIKRFYLHPSQINNLGSRVIFNPSQHRIIFRERNIVTGFLECKLINNSLEGLLNIGLLPKYKSLGFIAPTFINLLEQPQFKRTKCLYIAVHVKDSQMEQLLNGLRFERVIDKTIIQRLKLPLDGMHLTYKFTTGRK